MHLEKHFNHENLTMLTKNSTSRIKPRKKKKKWKLFQDTRLKGNMIRETNVQHTNTGVTFKLKIF